MRHLIVRHAHAGTRGGTDGDDLLRPLSEKGEAQAASIAKLLADRKIKQIWTSRATRCVDTVVPLGLLVDREVQETEQLLEGTDPRDTLSWLTSLTRPVVGCSHGDVIGGLVQLLAEKGVPIEGPLTWPKASIWDIRIKDGTVLEARFIAPPEV